MWQWHFFLTYMETGSLRIDKQSNRITSPPPPSLERLKRQAHNLFNGL